MTVVEALLKHTPQRDVGNLLEQKELDSIALSIEKATGKDPEEQEKEKDGKDQTATSSTISRPS